MTGSTIIEKLIAHNVGVKKVNAGEVHMLKPDVIIMYAWPAISDRYMDTLDHELNLTKLPYPEKMIFFCDHFVPPQNPEQSSFHVKSQEWCQKHNVKCITDKGIGHVVVIEEGLVKPGNIGTHFDMHISTIGAIGALGIGIMAEVLMPIATGNMWLVIPPTIRVNIEGAFEPGISGRDLLNRIVADYGPDWANGKIVEFGGPGAENISVDSRMVICDLANYFGAITAIFVPDKTVDKYMKEHDISNYLKFAPDDDAIYTQTVTYNLKDIEPTLTAPATVSNAVKLTAVEGTSIDIGIIGTCASGRLEDFEQAAKILKGKKLADGFKLYVSPSSNRSFKEALEKGYITTLVEAGAFISSPTCDFCYGKSVQLIGGQTAISTQTLNVPGRLGSLEASIYLASASVVAATSLYGKITDPRKELN